MRWLSIGKNILKMIVLLGIIAEKMIMPELKMNSFYENKSYIWLRALSETRRLSIDSG